MPGPRAPRRRDVRAELGVQRPAERAAPPARDRANPPDAVILNLQFATFGDRRLPGALGLLLPAILRARGVPTLVVLHNLADNVDMRDAGFARSAFTARLMTLAGRLLTRALLRADIVALTIPRYVEFLRDSYGATNAVLAPTAASRRSPRRRSASRPDAAPSWPSANGGRTRRSIHWSTPIACSSTAGTTTSDSSCRDRQPELPGLHGRAAQRYADVPHLEMPGYIAEEDVAPLFLSAAVVAFPYTSTTGSSGVLHQAGEYGRAAVLPRIGDLVDVIEEEGFQGVYFEPGDVDSLADALAAGARRSRATRDPRPPQLRCGERSAHGRGRAVAHRPHRPSARGGRT